MLLLTILIILIILQGILVIVSKNSIASILYLIGVYVLTSICFLIIGAEFLSIMLIIVYVGAVAILFIFIIMMLNLRIMELYNTIVTYLPIGAFIGLFFFFEIFYIIKIDLGLSYYYLNLDDYTSNWVYELHSKSNLNLLAEVLYNYFPYLVWIAGWILLLAMIGALALTIEGNVLLLSRKVQHSYVTTKRLNMRLSYWGIKKKT